MVYIEARIEKQMKEESPEINVYILDICFYSEVAMVKEGRRVFFQ